MKTLAITFDNEGNPKIETSGCKGIECRELTKGIEGALGAVIKDVPKPEELYNESNRDIRH